MEEKGEVKTEYCPHCDSQKVVVRATDEDGVACKKCMYCYQFIYGEDE